MVHVLSVKQVKLGVKTVARGRVIVPLASECVRGIIPATAVEDLDRRVLPLASNTMETLSSGTADSQSDHLTHRWLFLNLNPTQFATYNQWSCYAIGARTVPSAWRL